MKALWRGVAVAWALGSASPAAAAPALSLGRSSMVLPLHYGTALTAAYYPDSPSPSAVPVDVSTSAAWWSSDPLVAVVTAQGGVEGKKRGTVTVRATYEGLTASLSVKVAGIVTTTNTLVTGDGRTRTYTLYVPDTLVPSPPLVLVFHGGGGSGQGIMNNGQTNELADRYGFLAAYPDGLQNTWNAGACCGYAAEHHVDDVAFAGRLIDTLVAARGVDPTRVYAMGMSNGAMLSQRLACELSTKIAAIAPASGTLNLGGDFTACKPKRRVFVREFHGTTDENVPYNGGVGPQGGSGTDFYPVPATIADWVQRDGLPAGTTPQVTYQRGIETCRRYGTPPTTVSVELCTADPPVNLVSGTFVYDGGGHAWPGGFWSGGVNSAGNEADLPTQDLDLSSAAWQLFGSVVLDTTPPTAAIAVSPLNDASGVAIASATVTVTLTAADNLGVAEADFLIDGTTVARTTNGSISYSWDTRTGGNGPHTLGAAAVDAQGNSSAAAMVVNVSNAYVDAGLRAFDGMARITVAAEPLGTLTSPLRVIGADGRVHGVVLVDPSDPNASKLTIETAQGRKALRKL